LAFDPDEGEAGKIQFYFKEGDSLVSESGKFRIETETGKIHQIKPLDREEMNKHNVSYLFYSNAFLGCLYFNPYFHV
jgi:hypothetical protein